MESIETETINSNADLLSRTFQFSLDTLKFLKNLDATKENDVIKYQLAKSSTSVGANYEESQATLSKKDFCNKIGICLREIRESNYWLRLIKGLSIAKEEEVEFLINESEELKRIFGSIFKKTRVKEDF